MNLRHRIEVSTPALEGKRLQKARQKMKDKVVVITGASSGIGLATARELARQGGTIVMVCRDMERAEAARRDVAAIATGQQPAVFLADLLSQREIRRLAEAIKNRYAQIDVLINNAGAVFARR